MSRVKPQTTIDTLLADRVRFEAWLDQLAAKSAQVPEHVASRVRGDYEARLAQVIEELTSRADELRTESDIYAVRIAELDEELTRKRDARAEDELRALVGEYSEDEWTKMSAAHDVGLAGLEAERAAAEADMTRVRDLLESATRPSRALAAVADEGVPDEPTPVSADSEPAATPDWATTPEPAAPEATVPEPDAHAELTGAAAGEPSIESLFNAPAAVPEPDPAQARERKPSPFDEIAFLKTVVGRATPLGVPRTPAEPMQRVVDAEASPAQTSPAASAAPSRASIPTFEPPPIAAEPAAPAAPPARPAPPAPPVPRSSGADAPALRPTPAGDSLSGTSPFRSSIGGGEGARSLKCQECGWMNYPTEWYCEKCGGELAAF